MFLLRAARGPADEIRYGTVTSKRLGKAVRRNRARRLVREAMRRLCGRLRTGWDLVIVVRSGALGAKAGEVVADLTVLATRAGLFEGPPEDEVSDGGSTF
jgi:ribonuclease P protein component